MNDDGAYCVHCPVSAGPFGSTMLIVHSMVAMAEVAYSRALNSLAEM